MKLKIALLAMISLIASGTVSLWGQDGKITAADKIRFQMLQEHRQKLAVTVEELNREGRKKTPSLDKMLELREKRHQLVSQIRQILVNHFLLSRLSPRSVAVDSRLYHQQLHRLHQCLHGAQKILQSSDPKYVEQWGILLGRFKKAWSGKIDRSKSPLPDKTPALEANPSNSTKSAPPAVAPQENYFLFKFRGQVIGYVFSQKKHTQDPKSPILFHHSIKVHVGGEDIWVDLKTFCRNNDYYSPVVLSSKGQGPGAENFLATIDRKRPYGNSPGVLKTAEKPGKKGRTLAVPAHTVTDYVLFEIIPRLPFRKGVVFQFNYLESVALEMKKGHEILYLGREKIDVRGVSENLHKFVQKGRAISPIYYWVSEKRQLVRVLIDGQSSLQKELVATTRDQALETLPPKSSEDTEENKKTSPSPK